MLDRRLVFFLFYLPLLVPTLADESNANYASFPANENGTCYKRVPYSEALAANISLGLVKTPPGSQQAGVKSGSNRAFLTIIDCCEGFTRSESTGKCETHCDEGCFGGTCTGPNVCTCGDGWRPEAGVCKAICRRGCAENAYCFSPDICTCNFGYEEDEGVCKPVCRHGCPNGQCVAPRDCRCNPGYVLNEMQRCEPLCEGGCPHGRCVEPGICDCNHGYMNPANNQETCIPSCPDTCTSTNGQCHSPNICTCNPGYTQTPSGTCIPECLGDCPNGQCVAPEQCVCNRGFAMNHELRRCVEAAKGNNENYSNPTIPPETKYGSTYRPRESSQLRPPQDDLRRLQYNQSYGTQQPDRAYSTQGIIQNRNRPATNEQDDMYGTIGYHEEIGKVNQVHNSSRVVGIKGANNTQMAQGPDSRYQDYRNNQTYRPQEPFPSQGHYPTGQTSYERESDYPYRRYGNNTTPRSYRPMNSQGPFAPLEPYYPDNRELNHTTNPYERNRPYDTYGKNHTSKPLQPVNQQGPFPSQGSYPMGHHNDTYDWRDVDGPYHGDRRNNQTFRPEQRPYGTQGPYRGQEPRPTQETYPAQGPYSTQSPQHEQSLYPKLPSLPGQDSYTTRQPLPGQRIYPTLPSQSGQEPYSTHRPTQTHEQRENDGPYKPEYNGPTPNPSGVYGQNSQGPYTSHRPYGTSPYGQSSGSSHEFLGIKNPHRRPRPEAVNRNPGYAGVDLAYGINEMQNLPQNGNVNPSAVQNPDHTSVLVGLYDPYNPTGNGGSDSIYVLDPFGSYNPFLPPGSPPQIDPGFAPRFLGSGLYVPVCDSPCINSICRGNNVCQCKPGYEPDPINPNGFKCVPSCPGGCVNGVCSGPNLCICNLGFVKEHGVKGAQRCVPTY